MGGEGRDKGREEEVEVGRGEERKKGGGSKGEREEGRRQ